MLIGTKIKNTYSQGIEGEQLVKEHYEKLGFLLQAVRYKTKFGECDLVMSEGNQLVFIEVKSRKTPNKNYELITKKQILRNCNAAKYFISQHLHFVGFDVRFDFAIVIKKRIAEIIESAWGDESGD